MKLSGSAGVLSGQTASRTPAQPKHPANTCVSLCQHCATTIPGTDGTGQAIMPQIAALHATGFEVYCLNIPPADRSGWAEATQQVRS
jgi:hypothetical protein